MPNLPYNKVANVSDWLALHNDMREVYSHHAANSPTWPAGGEYRKQWEVAMAYRALRDFGALGKKARILGVGAGKEITNYHLTNHCEQVFATDLYGVGGWPGWADQSMLTAPELGIEPEYDWNPQRLVVQHMDGTHLRYPDAFFNGIFSSSSIEHFGTLDDVARSAREMGRVLKPGGIIALSTEFRIGGINDNGWGNVIMFNAETLRQYIIEPSGCELVDEPDYSIDEETLRSEQNLDWVIEIQRQGIITPAPHVVLEYTGHIFTSVSVVLRKPK
jgi:SAM-dependent methyltransferase